MISFGIEGIIALCTIIAISFRVIQNRVEDSSVDLGETVLGALLSKCLIFTYLIDKFIT